MKPQKLFAKIRLTLYFPVLFIIFLTVLHRYDFIADQAVIIPAFIVSCLCFFIMTLSSMTASKRRIELLTLLFRKESSQLYKVMLQARNLEPELYQEINENVLDYLRKKNHNLSPAAGGDEYQALMNITQRNGKKTVDILQLLVDNEDNRAEIAMQLRSKVYSHEWLIILGLYAALVWTALMIYTVQSYAVIVPIALILTTAGVFIVSLWKLSSLTHKHAWQVWSPFIKLIATKFERLD